MNDYVTFRIADRRYATRIDNVREVVRLSNLAVLPGMQAPLAGVLDLRGVSLPVVDVRPVIGGPGDVLVLHGDDGMLGFACDEVISVVGRESLRPEDSRARDALPAYVEEVLRGPDGAVFLVDVRRMAGERAATLASLAG